MKVYSAAFREGTSSSDSVLVSEVKADLDEMHREVSLGKMAVPSLDKSIDWSNTESPDLFGIGSVEMFPSVITICRFN